MQGDARVIEYLNRGLRHELAAINQYWLHYRLLDNWGYRALAKKWRQESIEEMQHADKIVERIIFLDGFPNMQVIDPLRIGQNVKEVLDCDLAAEMSARALYQEAATPCHAGAQTNEDPENYAERPRGLTRLGSFLMSARGTPLPTEGRLSGRVDHEPSEARPAAARSALLLRSLRQTSRLEPLGPHRRTSRTLAPLENWQSQAQACDRADARGAGSPRQLPHRHRAGFRHRRGRDGALVDARRAAGHHARVGIVRRRLGHRCHQGAQTSKRDAAQRALRRASRSFQGRSRIRRSLHLERHHLGRAPAERRLDRRRSARPRHL